LHRPHRAGLGPRPAPGPATKTARPVGESATREQSEHTGACSSRPFPNKKSSSTIGLLLCFGYSILEALDSFCRPRSCRLRHFVNSIKRTGGGGDTGRPNVEENDARHCSYVSCYVRAVNSLFQRMHKRVEVMRLLSLRYISFNFQ
jgi:hypothetical protein